MRTPHRHQQARGRRLSANERLKQGWNGSLALSLGAAVAFHLLLFAFWPETRIATEQFRRGNPATLVAVGSAPEVPVPRAPDEVRIERPSVPIVSEVALEPIADPAISLPDMYHPAMTDLLALVSVRQDSPDHWFDYEKFGPFLVYPRIRNETELRSHLQQRYTPLLRSTGASGVVMVAFWIDEDGSVKRTELAESSGYRSLDRLALQLSNLVRFSPALRMGQPVRVQVRLPIIFRET